MTIHQSKDAAINRYLLAAEGACDGKGAIFDGVGRCDRCGRSYDKHLLRELGEQLEAALRERDEERRDSEWNARRATDAAAFCDDAAAKLASAEAKLEAAATPPRPTGEGPVGITIHKLKIWPEFFAAVRAGEKRHEIRKDDRPFMTGDLLLLFEYRPHGEGYTGTPGFTGEMELVRVTFVSREFLPPGLVALSIERVSLVVTK